MNKKWQYINKKWQYMNKFLLKKKAVHFFDDILDAIFFFFFFTVYKYLGKVDWTIDSLLKRNHGECYHTCSNNHTPR